MSHFLKLWQEEGGVNLKTEEDGACNDIAGFITKTTERSGDRRTVMRMFRRAVLVSPSVNVIRQFLK